MRIKFHIPQNGYSAEIAKSLENGEYPTWVDRKFGGFIREQISGDFTLQVEDSGFVVDFVYEDDGIAFRKLLGGVIVD